MAKSLSADIVAKIIICRHDAGLSDDDRRLAASVRLRPKLRWLSAANAGALIGWLSDMTPSQTRFFCFRLFYFIAGDDRGLAAAGYSGFVTITGALRLARFLAFGSFMTFIGSAKHHV